MSATTDCLNICYAGHPSIVAGTRKDDEYTVDLGSLVALLPNNVHALLFGW